MPFFIKKYRHRQTSKALEYCHSQPMPTTTATDNPASESPIYIESISSRRESSSRALAADGHHRTPINPSEECWNQLADIPHNPPSLDVNAGPGAGVVELAAMVLKPVVGSKLKWEFANWVGGSGPPATPNVSTPLSRVIPATFGLGSYQPTLTGAPAHDGHSWVVDGLNHYVEFPYGPPPGLPAAPVLTFYRYTGITNGGGSGGSGGSGPLVLNRARFVITQSNDLPNISTAWPDYGIGAGAVSAYDPDHRCIPVEALVDNQSIFTFEVAGVLTSKLNNPPNSIANDVLVAIKVGDVFSGNANTLTTLLGPITVNLPSNDFFEQNVVWSYRLTATRTPSNTLNGLAFVWTAELSMVRNGISLTQSRVAVGKKDFGSIASMLLPDGIPLLVYIAIPNRRNDAAEQLVGIFKISHVFTRVV